MSCCLDHILQASYMIVPALKICADEQHLKIVVLCDLFLSFNMHVFKYINTGVIYHITCTYNDFTIDITKYTGIQKSVSKVYF